MYRFILTIALLLSSVTSFAADPPYYVRKATWHETLRSSRDALATQRGSHTRQDAAVLSTWKYCGPFFATGVGAFVEVFPPELKLSLDTSYAGLRWTDRPEWHDELVTDLGRDSLCAHYLYRTITVSHDTTLTLSLGSDDGINVWVNGTKILSKNEDRAAEADQEIVPCDLKAGTNTFLMKINNGFGPSGFYFAVFDNDVRHLTELVRRDFSDAVSSREMDWELADSIWTGAWTPANVRALALRYADHAPCATREEQDALGQRAGAATGPDDLASVRSVYLAAKTAQLVPEILTPKPPATPRINGARRIGARPGNPFLFIVPVSRGPANDDPRCRIAARTVTSMKPPASSSGTVDEVRDLQRQASQPRTRGAKPQAV